METVRAIGRCWLFKLCPRTVRCNARWGLTTQADKPIPLGADWCPYREGTVQANLCTKQASASLSAADDNSLARARKFDEYKRSLALLHHQGALLLRFLHLRLLTHVFLSRDDRKCTNELERCLMLARQLHIS